MNNEEPKKKKKLKRISKHIGAYIVALTIPLFFIFAFVSSAMGGDILFWLLVWFILFTVGSILSGE